MALHVTMRAGSPNLYIIGMLSGRGVNKSARTTDPVLAESFRQSLERKIWEEQNLGFRSGVKFEEAARAYLKFEARTARTKGYVEKLIGLLGQTELRLITQTTADEACAKLLSADACAATKVRCIYTPMRAVMKCGAVRKMCAMPAFETPKIEKPRMAFLYPAQVDRLIEAAAPHLRPLITFLAGTGARMSEALELDWVHVDLRGARAEVRQKQGDDRYIDLPPRVVAALATLKHREGRVFLAPISGGGLAPYKNTRDTGGQIDSGWATACRRAGLPGEWRVSQRASRPGTAKKFTPEVSPHCLRHTWASWHHCVHKNLLLLQGDGGWQSVTTASRYAKKMPDAYRDEILAWWAGGPVLMEMRA